MTTQQFESLKRTADRLFGESTSSTTFARILNNDYQYYCNEDIPSNDDFYIMSSEGNAPMRELLNKLGYEYTEFGICYLHPLSHI